MCVCVSFSCFLGAFVVAALSSNIDTIDIVSTGKEARVGLDGYFFLALIETSLRVQTQSVWVYTALDS